MCKCATYVNYLLKRQHKIHGLFRFISVMWENRG